MMKENIYEADLRQKISQDSVRITSEIKAEIGDLETEYLKARKEQKLGILLMAGAFLLPQFLGFFYMDAFAIIFMLVSLPCLIFGLKFYFKKVGIIENFHSRIDRVIFRKVFSLFGLSVKNTNKDILMDNNISSQSSMLVLKDRAEKRMIVLEDLDQSELITQNHNSNQVDDVVEIDYQDAVVRIVELDIKNITGGDKKHTEQFFHGYFVSFELKHELTGKTFVSTEGDKRGFGNSSVFGDTGEVQSKETILEWNEFENLLHVATTDEVEARYILTPNFMHDLYDWWQGRETNIRLSFIKNRLYILYPDKKIRLNQSVEKITEEAIAEYMFTIAWPLQNVLKLIDDVKL